MTIEMIKSGHYKSIPRNLQIANIFKEAEIIEKYGSGIKRVIESFKVYGLKEPQFEVMQGGLNVTVFNETAQETAQETTRDRILELLKENPKYTREELMHILNKADGTIKEHLSKLKKEGILSRIGSTKNGYWKVDINKP